MKKITKATFKSFLKKNEGHLYIQKISNFDGMTDSIEFLPLKNRIFVPLEKVKIEERNYQYGAEKGRTREQVEELFLSNPNTLGYSGIWLVNDSRDRFLDYDNDRFKGIEVYNSCGSFIVAVLKSISLPTKKWIGFPKE